MKKALFIASALLALVSFASCEKNAREFDTYTLTVEASRDASLSKALSLSGNTLNVVWASTDQVIVYNSSNTKIGTLTPQSTGSANAVLKGSIIASGISAGTKLRLVTPRENWLYEGQEGDFASVSKKFCYASAEVTVSSVNGSNVQTSAASFANQQAIVKFTLIDSKGAPINPDELTITTASNSLVRSFNAKMEPLKGDILVIPSDDTNELYIALRNESKAADTYNLTATAGKFTYKATKSGVNFQNGKYYAGTVKMAMQEDTYTVAGAPAAFFGTEWDATNTKNDMTRQADGTFLKVYNVTAVTDVSFKVAKNHTWGAAGVNNWPTDDISLTLGVGEFKVMFDPETKKVTYKYVDPGTVTRIYTVAGAANGETAGGKDDPVFGKTWAPDYAANDMTKQTNGTYTWTSASTVPAGTKVQFKVAVNHAWTTSYGYNGGSGNASYEMKANKKLTITFDEKTHYVTASEN